MAKSKSFFGLRSGSTKSHTYSVLDGVQITKDRVTHVANPRTAKQATQRMKMTAVINFYRGLQGILDHSFEGVAYGIKSRYHFLKLALASPMAVAGIMKDEKSFIPLALPVSTGSLPKLNYDFINDTPRLYTQNPLQTPADNTRANVVNAIRTALGLEDGQLTFIIAKEGALKIKRLILDPADEIIDDFSWILNHIVLSAGNSYIDYAEVVDAFAVILSQEVNGKWKRSIQEMALSHTFSQTVYSYDAVETAKRTYMDSASVSASNQYLNEGNTNKFASILGIFVKDRMLKTGDSLNILGDTDVVLEIGPTFKPELLEVAGDVEVVALYNRVTLKYKDSAPLVSDVTYDGLKLLSVTNVGKVLQSVTLAGNDVAKGSVQSEIGALVITHVAGYNVELFERGNKWEPVSTTNVSKSYNALSESDIRIVVEGVVVFDFSIKLENPTLPTMNGVALRKRTTPFNAFKQVEGRNYIQLSSLPIESGDLNINVYSDVEFNIPAEDSMGNSFDVSWREEFSFGQYTLPNEITYPYWVKIGNALLLYVTGE